MARIKLSAAQREELQSNSKFALHVKWALLDKASYWSAHDGSNPPGDDLERWRKSKTFAKGVIVNPSSVEITENVKRFLTFFRTEDCVDDAAQTFDASETIDFLLTGTPNNNKFDAAADAWFDAQIAPMP